MGQQLNQMSDIGQLIDAAVGAGTGTKHDASGNGVSAKATDIKTNISADEFGRILRQVVTVSLSRRWKHH